MINKDTIRKWWQIFVGDGNFTEVRILGRYQYSGYFKSLDNLIKCVEPYSDMDDEQIYFVLNKIDDACYGRQQSEKIVKSPKITTNDPDIVRRTWVMVDFDPLRKSGVNASDEEYEYAHKKARVVYRFLRDKGFSEPVICKSGNGIHLDFKVDLPTDEETREIIKNFFAYLGLQYNDDKVEIDPKNFNESRLCKLYSTTAKKGANLPDRPWRESSILYVPKEIQITPIEKFKELADLLPKPEPKQPVNQRRTSSGYNNNSQPFNLVSWLNEHGIKYREKKSGSSTLYELEQCPWIDSHSDHKKWDSALFQDIDGKITFNCTHSHCKDKTWQDVRLFYEPDAYDRKYQPQPAYTPRQRTPQKPKYEIKEEVSELGAKWLKPSQIKKLNLSQIEKVKTGFIDLDKKIRGLHMGEISILSGSNSSGKSSWLNSLILNIIEQDYKVALWSGELRADVLKTWIQMVACGKSFLMTNNYGDFYVPDNISVTIDEWLDDKLYIYNNEYGCKWEQIFNDMNEMLARGVKVFILDNLFTLDIDIFDGDKNNKQKDLVLQIKDFAKNKLTHNILVAHPRKVMTFLRKNDISGTGDIQNAADNIFIMHRVNNDFLRAGAEFFGTKTIDSYRSFGNVIEVAKNRMYGIVDYLVGLHYEIESRRFLNTIGENKVYGWHKQPVQQTLQLPPNNSFDSDDSDDWLTPRDEEPPF